MLELLVLATKWFLELAMHDLPPGEQVRRFRKEGRSTHRRDGMEVSGMEVDGMLGLPEASRPRDLLCPDNSQDRIVCTATPTTVSGGELSRLSRCWCP